MDGSSTASRIAGSAPVAEAVVGASRLKAAFALLGVMTVEVAVLVVSAFVALVLDANWAWSRLTDAGVGWPFGTLIAAAASALTIGAVWRGWDLGSMRLLVAATVVWAIAGVWVVAAGATTSPLSFALIALVLEASVAWSRRRAGSTRR